MDTSPALKVSARRRSDQWESARVQRRQRAWEVAHQAAALLKDRYAATRVVAFGSLSEPDRFHPWSDVDLAAWGLPLDCYFGAVAALLDLGDDIRIDLIMAERAKPAFRAAIEAGIEL